MTEHEDHLAHGRVRLRTLNGLRWIAIAGQITAVLVARHIFDLDIDLGLCSVVIGASIIANIVGLMVYSPAYRLTNQETAWALVFDVVQLFGLLMLTGGLHNPFALLIVAPVTISATTLSFRATTVIAALAVVLVSLLRFLFVPLTTVEGEVLALPRIFADGLWAAITLGIVFLSIYAGRVTSEIETLARALTATQMALSREQKLTDLGGVVAAAAHELGTPLATIKLASSELVDELSEYPELAADARLIREQADRCRDILHSMGQVGKDDLMVRHAPLGHVVHEAAEPHRDRGKHLRIDDSDTDQPMIRRRPEIVHGLRNLIQNAVDFADTEVVVDLAWSEDWITIRIADDGPGFPGHLLGRLGEPFTRPRRSRRGGYEGMGLGLFIAKTLLERTGAELSFANAAGAVVEVRWPSESLRITAAEAREALGENQAVSS